LDTTNAEEEDDDGAGLDFFLYSLLRGVNGGNNPTRSSTSDGVSEFMKRLITEDDEEEERAVVVTMSEARPPGNTGETVPPWPDIGMSMDSLIPPPGETV
jgi:hypothetical protein